MNWAHVHLMLSHLPVVGTIFGVLLLLLALLRKSEELKRVSLGVFEPPRVSWRQFSLSQAATADSSSWR